MADIDRYYKSNVFKLFEDDTFNRLFPGLNLFNPLVNNKDYHINSVDVYETENDIKVIVDVPGYKNEDVEITLMDNTLKVSGKREQTLSTEETQYIYRGRSYSSFSETFTLPSAVKDSEINATMKDGVLTIVLPKENRTKSINVKIDNE